jgi:hypothetical protein
MSTATTDDIRAARLFADTYAPEHARLVVSLVLDGFHPSESELWRRGEQGWAVVAFDDLHVYVRAYEFAPRVGRRPGGGPGNQQWQAVFVQAPLQVVRAAAAAVK